MGSRYDKARDYGKRAGARVFGCNFEFIRLPEDRQVNVWENHNANYDLDEMLFVSLFSPTSEMWRKDVWRGATGWLSAMYFLLSSQFSPEHVKKTAEKLLLEFYAFDAPTNRLTDGKQNCVWFENTTEPRHGYVYIMVSDDWKYYKIGVSVDPPDRLKQVSPLMPFDVNLLLTIETNSMFDLEKELHYEYRWKRKKGEWFTLSPSDINMLNDKYPVNMIMNIPQDMHG